MTLLRVITIMMMIMLMKTNGRFISQITVGDHFDYLVVGHHNNDDNYVVDNCWSIYISDYCW